MRHKIYKTRHKILIRVIRFTFVRCTKDIVRHNNLRDVLWVSVVGRRIRLSFIVLGHEQHVMRHKIHGSLFRCLMVNVFAFAWPKICYERHKIQETWYKVLSVDVSHKINFGGLWDVLFCGRHNSDFLQDLHVSSDDVRHSRNHWYRFDCLPELRVAWSVSSWNTLQTMVQNEPNHRVVWFLNLVYWNITVSRQCVVN